MGVVMEPVGQAPLDYDQVLAVAVAIHSVADPGSSWSTTDQESRDQHLDEAGVAMRVLEGLGWRPGPKQ